MREFDGYRRVAVVVLTDDETYRARAKRREEADGKEVPDGAVVDMKGSYTPRTDSPTRHRAISLAPHDTTTVPLSLAPQPTSRCPRSARGWTT